MILHSSRWCRVGWMYGWMDGGWRCLVGVLSRYLAWCGVAKSMLLLLPCRGLYIQLLCKSRIVIPGYWAICRQGLGVTTLLGWLWLVRLGMSHACHSKQPLRACRHRASTHILPVVIFFLFWPAMSPRNTSQFGNTTKRCHTLHWHP